jgi:hypothetical protein
MKPTFKGLLMVTIASVGIAIAGGGVIAQQAQPDAAPTASGTPAQKTNRGQGPDVGSTPNAGRDQGPNSKQGSGGIDPELGPIPEPDSESISPALQMKGGGDWQSPQDLIRERARQEALERAEKLGLETKSGVGADADGLILPTLAPPTIPLVPMELLFPPEAAAQGPAVVRESRGTNIVVGALDRESRTNTRLSIPTGGQGVYGSLRVKVSGCYMSHPDDTFEAWAYVEVSDTGRADRKQLAVLPQRDRNRVKAETGERLLRKGWVIASSPSVTPIDHPIYDMWLISCEGNAAPEAQEPEGSARLAPAATPAPAATARPSNRPRADWGKVGDPAPKSAPPPRVDGSTEKMTTN